jgi:sortase (surface protein transpeptidase)
VTVLAADIAMNGWGRATRHPRQRLTLRLITLITCDPAWTGTHRVIVTGVLVAAKPR